MRKSFSLVELLIVVTIISVLTGAALPFVSEYLQDAKFAKARNDLDEIARAISAYETVEAKDYSDTTGKALIGRFIQKIPIDPWGTPYQLGSATEGNGAFISSYGPDHKPSNDDIKVDYKGKLTIVSAKWFDSNGDGKISISTDASYPGTDTFTIRFNRGVKTGPSHPTIPTTAASVSFTSNWDLTGASSFANLFDSGSSIATVTLSTDGKGLIFEFQNAPAVGGFALGSDTVQINNVSQIRDLGNNQSIQAPVTISAQ